MSRELEECPACHVQAVLRPTTTDCDCRVCVQCGDQFLEDGYCGICGTRFMADEPETLEDEGPYSG